MTLYLISSIIKTAPRAPLFIMIFFTGHHNTGKSTAAHYLKEKYGFCHVETGTIVRSLYIQSGSNLAFGDWAVQHQHFFDEAIVAEINRHVKVAFQSNGGIENVIITGNRQIEGICYITDHIKSLNDQKNLIMFFEAEPKILYARYLARIDRPVAKITFNKFVRDLLDYDRKMGVEKIKEHAHVTIRNEGSVQAFLESVVRELRLKGYELPAACNQSPERFFV